MILSKSLIPIVLPVLAFLLLSARASPHPRAQPSTSALKLTVRRNSFRTNGAISADRARARALLQRSVTSSISATNYANAYYSADVGVGSPPTYYTLLVDTGSSNTWVGANKAYTTTSTSVDTGNTFYIQYGSASQPPETGEEYLDTVTFNSDLVITNQSIGVGAPGLNAGLPSYFNGILGLGPVDMTQGTVSNTNEVPTVMDNLHSQGTIGSEVLGVFFSPASSSDSIGELTFGSYDASKIIGDVSYVPITSASPSSEAWGIDQSISYGGTEILSKTAGVIDSGTPNIYIATDAFAKYQSATGATLDQNTGHLMISSDQYANLSSLYFNIGGVSYELTPNAQIWPRSLNSDIGGTSDGIYLIVGDMGRDSGYGLDFINGHGFLQRFYTVLDTTNTQVGFATTVYTDATSN